MTTPPYLKKDDIVGLIAPAKNFDAKSLQMGIEILRTWGLQVRRGKNIYNQYGPFAGTDQERAEDLQAMIDDENVKAIFSVRGGYGCNRIIDTINWENFKASPKWVVGFSDITLLLCKIRRLGIESVHGIMPLQFGLQGTEISTGELRKVLFGEHIQFSIEPHHLNRLGRSEGEVIGGNLAILCSAIGTDADFETEGKILFIEDIGEYLYRFDRMMVQLRRANKLSKLSGLIVGHLSDMQDNPIPFGMDAKEIVYKAVKEYSYPVSFDFPIGHERANYPVIIGRHSILEVSTLEVRLSFRRNYSL